MMGTCVVSFLLDSVVGSTSEPKYVVYQDCQWLNLVRFFVVTDMRTSRKFVTFSSVIILLQRSRKSERCSHPITR